MAWHPHLDVLLLVGGLLWIFERAARTPARDEPRDTSRQRTFFYIGLATLLVARSWPLHDLGESRLFAFHMLEHLLLAFVVPPLLLIGMPAWMLRRLVGPFMGIVKVVTKPLVALLVFNAVIAGIHVPWIVNQMLTSSAFHLLAHGIVIVAAACMWSPVVNPLVEVPKLNYPQRMFYLFLQSLVPTVPASFLTFGETVLYPFYASAPRLWGIDALTDQRIAGLMMKIGGGFLLWGVIGYYFFRWMRVEETEGIDVMEWGKMMERT